MTPLEQIEKWAAGESIHNPDRNECCPDFSCCFPELKWTNSTREQYLHHARKNDRGRLRMLLVSSLKTLASSIDREVKVINSDPLAVESKRFQSYILLVDLLVHEINLFQKEAEMTIDRDSYATVLDALRMAGIGVLDDATLFAKIDSAVDSLREDDEQMEKMAVGMYCLKEHCAPFEVVIGRIKDNTIHEYAYGLIKGEINVDEAEIDDPEN